MFIVDILITSDDEFAKSGICGAIVDLLFIIVLVGLVVTYNILCDR